MLIGAVCLGLFCVTSFGQSSENSSGPIPVKSDRIAAPPAPQKNQAPASKGTEQNNKVMLRSQTDSMDSKKMTTPTVKLSNDSLNRRNPNGNAPAYPDHTTSDSLK